jgi:hypothetical protein
MEAPGEEKEGASLTRDKVVASFHPHPTRRPPWRECLGRGGPSGVNPVT